MDNMKTRKGFISNSSSSSFIILLPKKPESSDELRSMIFKEDNIFESIYNLDYLSNFLFDKMGTEEDCYWDFLNEGRYEMTDEQTEN
jgi:DUF438 domain-containing protein